MATFKAIMIEKTEAGPKAGLADFDERDLMEGDVTVRVEWSTLNYKDGLAITGKVPVVRRFPMIPEIDFAGTVETSTASEWKAGRQGHSQRLGTRVRRTWAATGKRRGSTEIGWCDCRRA